MTATIQPLYALAGLMVGLLVGMTGVGGGSLMTPLLVLMFGFHPSVAVGTDLLYAAATKSVGSAVHGWRGSVNWRIVGLLGAGSLPAAVVSLVIIWRLGTPTAATATLLKTILGVTLVLTAAALLLRQPIAERLAQRGGPGLGQRSVAVLTMVLGVVIGAAVTFSSVGAGAIGATALIILYPRLSVERIVGTDIAHAVPLTLLSGLGHWYLNTVDMGLLLSLLMGSVPGIVAGSLLAGRTHERILRPLLAVVLVVVGLMLLF